MEAWRQSGGIGHCKAHRGGVARASAPHGRVTCVASQAQLTVRVRGQGLLVGERCEKQDVLDVHCGVAMMWMLTCEHMSDFVSYSFP